jgi:Type IV secretion system pilin
MKLFQRLLLVCLIMTGLSFATMPVTTHAIDVLKPVCDKAQNDVPTVCKDNGAKNGDKDNPIFGPDGILTKAINILSFVVGVLAVFIIIIFGGLRMITSGGNSQTIASARQTIIYAVIGLLVAILARVIVAFVIAKV